jgi:hypothetical protein
VEQEAAVQREEYVTEVRRLQRTIRKLRTLYKSVLEDNSQVAHMKENLPALTAKNQRLEASVAVRSVCSHPYGLIPKVQLFMHMYTIPKYKRFTIQVQY